MIALLQRVTSASVTVENTVLSSIESGLLVLLAVEKDDTPARANRMVERLCSYRVFADENGKMNLNIRQSGGEILLVSQFTLAADTNSGNRPSFTPAASPELGEALYEHVLAGLSEKGVGVQGGRFRAHMQVALVNDGPVTFQLTT